jgi:hypothetical protein
LESVPVSPGYVVLVLLHFSEGVLVVLHQLIDVLMLALLNLVDLNFLPQFKLSLQHLVFLLICPDVLRLFNLLLHGQAL